MLCDAGIAGKEDPMLRMRIANLVKRLGGAPCPECSGPVRWLETVDAGREDEAAEDGPAEPCPRCGRPLAVSFIEVVLPARQDT